MSTPENFTCIFATAPHAVKYYAFVDVYPGVCQEDLGCSMPLLHQIILSLISPGFIMSEREAETAETPTRPNPTTNPILCLPYGTYDKKRRL